MNFRMCLVGYWFIVFAISVTGRKHKPTPEIQTPYGFGYKKNDRLDMHLSFKMPSNLTGGLILLRDSRTDYHLMKTFEIVQDYKANRRGEFNLEVHPLLTSDHIIIDIQLYKNTGVCLNQRITEGREVKTSTNTRNSTCLNGSNCQITLDLRKECEDAKIAAAPAKIPIESLTEMSDEPPLKRKAITKVETTNHNTIIIICLSIFARMLFVVVILAFWRRYWINRSPPTIQSPLPRNPFYVNLLFRKECQKEIDELEQHIYEEIV